MKLVNGKPEGETMLEDFLFFRYKVVVTDFQGGDSLGVSCFRCGKDCRDKRDDASCPQLEELKQDEAFTWAVRFRALEILFHKRAKDFEATAGPEVVVVPN